MSKVEKINNTKDKFNIPWDNLSYEQKKPYYLFATQILFKNQLADENSRLEEYEIEFKKNFIEKGYSFNFNYLNLLEKNFVEFNARLLYENKFNNKEGHPYNENVILPTINKLKKKKLYFSIIFGITIIFFILSIIIDQIAIGSFIFLLTCILFLFLTNNHIELKNYNYQLVYCPKCSSYDISYILKKEDTTTFTCKKCKHEWDNQDNSLKSY